MRLYLCGPQHNSSWFSLHTLLPSQALFMPSNILQGEEYISSVWTILMMAASESFLARSYTVWLGLLGSQGKGGLQTISLAKEWGGG